MDFYKDSCCGARQSHHPERGAMRALPVAEKASCASGSGLCATQAFVANKF